MILKRSIVRFLYQLQYFATFTTFWNAHPALFFGLSVLLGSSFFFYPHWTLGMAFALLCATRKNARVITLALLCACGAYLFTQWRHPLVTLPAEKIPGVGIFHIDQVKPYASFFNRSLLYKGTLKEFRDHTGHLYAELPCHIYLPVKGKHPAANTDYLITGALSQKESYSYVLKPEKNKSWQPLKPFLPNLAQWRYDTKQALLRHLKAHIHDPPSCTLLHALITGEVDERILSLELSKIGVQHMLAVSGFHFALLTLFLTLLLRLALPRRPRLCVLIAALSLYYLFVGPSPAIQRAYIAILLVAIGQLFDRRISGLNALGMGLLIEIVCKPLNILDLGFQFSFLCTLAILLLHPLVNTGLETVLLKRSKKQVIHLSRLSQHAYLLSALVRPALSINLAVHLFSIPVTLFLFHRFPLLSLLYNLLFPACITISMILLFTALLFLPVLPCITHLIHALNERWTSTLLSFSSNPPAPLGVYLRTSHLALPEIFLFLCVSFFCAAILLAKKESALNDQTVF